MDKPEWYFTREQLENTPTRRAGADAARELSYRQQAGDFLQDLGQRLHLSQLCINTAIIYMHRFFMCHSFTDVNRIKISISSLFLSAKVEEQHRKLEHVIKMAHSCLHKNSPNLDVRSEDYTVKLNETVDYENILLQTLGFDVEIEHPHTYVVKVCQLVKASKDIARTSYIMATTSLHMTTMCLRYRPKIVACVCIHLACKWSSYVIKKCSEGKDWFYYVDKDVTFELLERLAQEFIEILYRSPHRFEKFCNEVPVTVPKPLDPSEPGPSGVNVNDITNHHAVIPIKNNVRKEKEETKVKKEEEEQKIRKEKEENKMKKEKELPPPPPIPQTPLPPPPPSVHLPNDHSSNKRSKEESAESSGGKRHKSKHVSKTKSSSSNHSAGNHSEPSAHGIKVKIRKDFISLSGFDCNQKYAPPVKAETPQKPFKITIRLPKPPPFENRN